MTRIHRREIVLAIAVSALLGVQFFLPHLSQEQAYHQFADTRTLWGVANAMNTLSNLAFIVVGGAGLALMRKQAGSGQRTTSARSAMTALFFLGLVATGAGSAWYHIQAMPNDAALAFDRYGMVLAFAGILGLAAADRVSENAGRMLGAVALLAGPLAIWWWVRCGDLAPYATLQFGGILALVLMLFWRGQSAGPNWGMLLACYALAKVLEAADAQVWTLTVHTISGHTLKHLAAACAGIAVIVPLIRIRP